MIAPWQPLFTDYEMMDFQRSFGVFVGFLIIPALVNLVVYVRGVRKLERAESPGRILGRFLAVVGGLITFVGVSLPLGSVHFLGPSLTDTSLRFPGDGGWIVLVFGSLWFAFFAVPKKVAAIWGIVWGILAVVFILVSLQGLANLVARSPGVLYIDEGVYVTIFGSILLMIGSTLAYIKAGRTSIPTEIPPDVAAPPTS